MSSLDLVGLASAGVISAAFYGFRGKLSLFVLVYVVALGGATLSAWAAVSVAPVERFTVVGGTAVYGFGFLCVRIILRRSVSLHLLCAIARGEPPHAIEEHLSRRIAQAVEYRLAHREGDRLRLSRFGRFVATVMRLLYGATGN